MGVHTIRKGGFKFTKGQGSTDTFILLFPPSTAALMEVLVEVLRGDISSGCLLETDVHRPKSTLLYVSGVAPYMVPAGTKLQARSYQSFICQAFFHVEKKADR